MPADRHCMSYDLPQSKLALITGIAVSGQKVTLHQPTSATSYELTEGAFIANLDDEDKTLGDYGVREGDVIKVSLVPVQDQLLAI